MTSTHKTFVAASAALVGLTLQSSAVVTYLVDFQNDTPIDSVAADFAGVDSNVEAGAIVNDIATQSAGNIINTSVAGTSGDGATLAVASSTGTNSFAGFFGPTEGGVAIYDGYYARGNSNGQLITISGLDFVPDEFVTVTVYALGDAVDQGANLTVAYDGTSIGPVFQSAVGFGSTATRSAPSQFSFIATGADEITIDNTGDTAAFSAINGFSITSGVTNPIPEPSTALLAGLGIIGLIRRRRSS